MPRKPKKYHYIYKTTNLINQKFYIGMHSTNDITDGYIGSSQVLWYSIKKYGRENFKFEILEYLSDRKSLAEKEKEIINKELLQNPLCMNIHLGGEGGWPINRVVVKDKNGDKFSISKDDPRYLSKEFFGITKGKVLVKDQNGNRFSVSTNDPRYLSGELVYNWTGKKHKEETKKKIGKKNSVSQKGESNSQFGKCWIHHLELKQSKSVKKEEIDQYLAEGWIKGRIQKFINEFSFEKINEVYSYKEINLTISEISKLTNLSYGSVKSILLKNPLYLSKDKIIKKRNKISVKDKDDNILIVSNNDPRYLSGDLISLHKNKNKFIAKDKHGNKFRIDKQDPRYLSGELVHHLKKKNNWE